MRIAAQGHHVLTFFNLSGSGLETPIDRKDWLDGKQVTPPLRVPGMALLCPDGVSYAVIWHQPYQRLPDLVHKGTGQAIAIGSGNPRPYPPLWPLRWEPLSLGHGPQGCPERPQPGGEIVTCIKTSTEGFEPPTPRTGI